MNSIVVRVHATDDDEGINGEISYFLLNEQQCFDIDSQTGDIRVQCVLDYEKQSKYRLEIEARDNGEGYQTDFSIVLIELIDENDNAPRIDIYRDDLQIDSNQRRLIFVNESLDKHSLICSISIVDFDSNENSRISWKLHRQYADPFELIRLTETTGEIRTTNYLDREYRDQYNLTIEAHDHGKPYPKTSYLNIQITILDINDNRPRFRQENSTVTINEQVQFDSIVGYQVFQIHADDYDQDLNGQVSYVLLNDENQSFTIDSQTGIIRARKQFQRKIRDTYVLHIQARDHGKR